MYTPTIERGPIPVRPSDAEFFALLYGPADPASVASCYECSASGYDRSRGEWARGCRAYGITAYACHYHAWRRVEREATILNMDLDHAEDPDLPRDSNGGCPGFGCPLHSPSGEWPF